jgi:hypothetical protein
MPHITKLIKIRISGKETLNTSQHALLDSMVNSDYTFALIKKIRQQSQFNIQEI